MPTVLRAEGFRFFFFSNEGTEPPHIHAERGDGHAKFWLEPVSLAVSRDLKSAELKRAKLLVIEHRLVFGRNGVNTSAPEQPRAISVDFVGRDLVVRLEDGRSVQVPLDWFPRLRDAKREDLGDWRLIGRGVGIHWPKLDEDLSVSGLLAPRARRPSND